MLEKGQHTASGNENSFEEGTTDIVDTGLAEGAWIRLSS